MIAGTGKLAVTEDCINDEEDEMSIEDTEAQVARGEEISSEDLGRLLEAHRLADTLVGDWPDGQVARTLVLRLSDGSHWGVDVMREPWPYGDPTDEWLGKPYRMTFETGERIVPVRTWHAAA